MDDLERAPLLNETESSSTNGRGWKLITAACLVGAAVVGGVAYTQKYSKETTTTSQQLDSKVDYEQFGSGSLVDGWYIYKVAFAAKDGETEALLRFMSDHSGGTSCEAVNLGCDGYKITCDYGLKQIHYVVAPALRSEAVDGDNLGVNGWNELAMTSFGDMTKFTPFMHNKVQLFIEDVVTKAKELEAGGYSVMRRSSLVTEENANDVDVRHTVGHAMVAIGGKIWDFVGELDSPSAAADEGFVTWAEDECPLAHEIRATNFAALRTQAAKGKTTSATLISIQTGTSSLTSFGSVQQTGILKQLTGGIVETVEGATCQVQVMHYDNEWEELTGGNYGGQLYMKNVVNTAKQTLSTGQTVKDYEDYVYKVHERYLSKPDDGDISHRWRNWDHWLDQHIGVKYAGSSMISQQITFENTHSDDDNDHSSTPSKYDPSSHGDDSSEDKEYLATPKSRAEEQAQAHIGTILSDDEDDRAYELDENCLTMAAELNEVMLDEHLLVGKRFILSDGDHYYVGFEGSSLATEFNTECHYSDVGSSDICTCVEMNSEDYAMAHYDMKYSSCYELHEN